ncbi:hypothetical protein [Pseudomonas sp. Q1-7]|uniref:hypothetical protein n=1 Tax=Pseudomonas sp. Q1-7 TaxID=3020843 RepID=UPI002300568D|nr:hypothetical protein [Pseudomonas sp. Q1-7]
MRTLLPDDQPWFAVSDLGRLMQHPRLAEGVVCNLAKTSGNAPGCTGRARPGCHWAIVRNSCHGPCR